MKTERAAHWQGQIERRPPAAQDTPIWSMLVRWFAGHPENDEQNNGPTSVAGIDRAALLSSMHAYVYEPKFTGVAIPNALEIAWHSPTESCAANHAASLIVKGKPRLAHTSLHA